MPFLMFTGQASEALDFYLETFADARVESVENYGEGEQMPPTAVKAAIFTVAGQRIRAFDSPPVHAFTFTPSISSRRSSVARGELCSIWVASADRRSASLWARMIFGRRGAVAWMDMEAPMNAWEESRPGTPGAARIRSPGLAACEQTPAVMSESPECRARKHAAIGADTCRLVKPGTHGQ
jgi:predicted 3-demethylubiquinone-9 3-methyltransferase (glyoxalase superfamily)